MGVLEPKGLGSVAAQIRALRKERGLTQAQLAARLGKSVSLVALWENPAYERHSTATLAKIAAAFGLVLRVQLVAPDEPRDAQAAFEARRAWFTALRSATRSGTRPREPEG